MTPQERYDFVVNHAFGGWHHVQNAKPNGAGTVFNYSGDVSTSDWTVLTRLVLACHAMRVRAEIKQAGPRALKFFLNARRDDPKNWSEHHPSLDDLIMEATKLKVLYLNT
jgi:hypothetical protein